jgi:hypothetical protein
MLLKVVSVVVMPNSIVNENLLTPKDSQSCVNLIHSVKIASHLILSSSCIQRDTHVLDAVLKIRAGGYQLLNSARFLSTIDYSCTRRAFV